LLQCLRAGSLTALSKPNGGVRPIVTRDTWLRLLSKSIVVAEQSKLSRHLAPTQAGVGLAGGTEFIIHSARHMLNAHPTWCLLAIDCSNAYGTIKRDDIKNSLSAISDKTGCTLAQTYFNRYCDPTQTIRAHTGASWTMAEGVMQGDPLSPLLFSLALDSTLKVTQTSLTHSAEGARVFAYLDDVCLVGPATAVSSAFTIFKNHAQSAGLAVNSPKSQLLSLDDSATHSGSDVLSLIAHHELSQVTQCITLLGTPIGKSSLEQTCAQTVLVDDSKFQRLCQVPNKQIRLAMLRYSIGVAHSHIVRTLTPSAAKLAAQKHDSLVNLVVTTLVDFVHSELPTVTKSEFSLPVKMGGLGLTPLSNTANQAYLTSLWLTINSWRSLVDDNSALLKQLSGQFVLHDLTPEFQSAISFANELCSKYIDYTSRASPTRQTGLTVQIPKLASEILSADMPRNLYKQLNTMMFSLATANLLHTHLGADEHKAQFRSKQGFGAGAFLTALPSDRSLQFSNFDFTLALRTWLRLPVLPLFNLQGTEACNCRRIDSLTTAATTCTEQHLLNCNGQGHLTTRHDAIVAAIQKMAQSVRLNPVLEPLAHVQPLSQHRFDLAIARADSLQSNLKLDVTVRNPQAKQAVKLAAKYSMHAANEGYKEKIDFYKPHLKPDDTFIPVVLETFGAMHQGVRDLVSLLSQRANNAPPADAAYTSPTFTAYWTQRISATLWRENVRMITAVATATSNSDDEPTFDANGDIAIAELNLDQLLAQGAFPALPTAAQLPSNPPAPVDGVARL